MEQVFLTLYRDTDYYCVKFYIKFLYFFYGMF